MQSPSRKNTWLQSMPKSDTSATSQPFKGVFMLHKHDLSVTVQGDGSGRTLTLSECFSPVGTSLDRWSDSSALAPAIAAFFPSSERCIGRDAKVAAHIHRASLQSCRHSQCASDVGSMEVCRKAIRVLFDIAMTSFSVSKVLSTRTGPRISSV